MDTKRSKLNILVSVIFKVATVLLVILVRRQLIRSCGNEINGLNSLFISITGFLAVAELGVGSAITYCMYQPIVDGDVQKVSALYQLFRKAYRIIGGLILAGGLLVMPFLRYLAKDYAVLDVNLHLTFFLTLFANALTYCYGEKTALINAHKNNYISTAIESGGLVLESLLQIGSLLLTGSYFGYLACKIIAVCARWGVANQIAKKNYAAIIADQQTLDQESQKDVIKNVKALFMHKIGGLLVNSADSIVISAFVGVVALGEYANYASIQTSMAAILGMVFTSLTSIFGHLFAQEDRVTSKRYCEFFYLLNFLIGTVFYLGYYAVVDNLVAILFGADLLVEKHISFAIALNGFIQFMRRSTLTFRDATGTFYYDRWKPLIEGTVNIALSIFLVQRIGMVGAITATMITNLLICHIVEPYVLYKNAFGVSVVPHLINNYFLIALFTGALLLTRMVMQENPNQFVQLLMNGMTSVGISIVTCAVAMLLNKNTSKQMFDLIMKSDKNNTPGGIL